MRKSWRPGHEGGLSIGQLAVDGVVLADAVAEDITELNTNICRLQRRWVRERGLGR